MTPDAALTARPRPPHVVYVAWGYPPCRGGGAYRALATANRFAERGWRVTVVTADRESFERYTGTDPTLEERIHPSIRVVRVPFRWPFLETDLRQWSRLRLERPTTWAKLRRWLDTVSFPEVNYGPWRRSLERAVHRVHADEPADLVVATANPNVDFAAAWRLHRQHGVPYVMDYRDAWLLDVFEGEQLHGDRSRAARWERRLLSEAEEVWFVNEPIRNWHAERYPSRAGRMHVVSNGFDPELAPAVRDREATAGRPLTFGYVGTISPKVPLHELLEGWRQARARHDVVARSRLEIHGYLGYFATPRAELARLLADAEADGVTYLGPVGKGEIGKIYDGFDILVLALGTGRYVTSGKVFEYLATGLPIVSVHHPENAASDVLHGYPLWSAATDLSAGAVASAIIGAADLAAGTGPQVRRQACMFGSRYRRDLLLDPRLDALARVVERGRSAVVA